jgi:clumping factor A
MRKITRREVLAGTVAIGAAGLAGCVSGDGDDNDAESGNGDSDTGSGNGDSDTGSENGDSDTGSENGDSDTGSGNGDSTGDGNGDQDSNDGTDDGQDGDDTEQDSDEGTGNVDPEISIETLGAECGTAEDETVDLEFGDDVITVTGTTPAPNPCHEVFLESGTVEDDSFSLSVNVRENLGDGEVCASCQGAIEYEAQIRPEDVSSVTEGSIEHVQGNSHGFARDSTEVGGDGTGSSGVTDASIRTTDGGCTSGDGEGRDEVTLSQQDSGFVIDGEITVPTPCHEATLAPVELENGTLGLDVGVQSTSEMCQDCLGLIEYEAVVDLDDPGSVDSVAVSHPDDERYLLDPN